MTARFEGKRHGKINQTSLSIIVFGRLEFPDSFEVFKELDILAFRVATKILRRFWGRAADTGSMIL